MAATDFLEIADAVLPGRDDLLTVLQAYFDESYGPSGLLCVAGYVFDKRGARGLTREWSAMLKQYGLPYFRMSACAHGNEPFHNIGKPTCDKIARRAISLIKKHASFGVANTVNEPEFNAKVPDGDQIGNARAYEFLTWNCLMGVRQVANDRGYRGKVAYYFEAGHKSQGQANSLMNVLFKIPSLREEYRMRSFGFVAKEDDCCIQAADLIAWQFFTDRKRELDGRPRRKDMESLLTVDHIFRHVDVDKHAAMVSETMAEIASRTGAAGQFSPSPD